MHMDGWVYVYVRGQVGRWKSLTVATDVTSSNSLIHYTTTITDKSESLAQKAKNGEKEETKHVLNLHDDGVVMPLLDVGFEFTDCAAIYKNMIEMEMLDSEWCRSPKGWLLVIDKAAIGCG